MPGFSIEDYLEEIVQEVEKRQQETGDILVKQENHKDYCLVFLFYNYRAEPLFDFN